jgi:propanol-preferring alcohol dehydrogenase
MELKAILNLPLLPYLAQDESCIGHQTETKRLMIAKGEKPIAKLEWPREAFWLYGVVEPLSGWQWTQTDTHLNHQTLSLILYRISGQGPSGSLVMSCVRHYPPTLPYYGTMRAMLLKAPGQPLREADLPVPNPGIGQVLIRVHTCGVCRTDLHVVDGELPQPKLPLVPGHQIVGTVVEVGKGVERFGMGDRVGVPWLGYTCNHCRYCLTQRENLCDAAQFTGYQIDGGYAEYTVADERFCFPIPQGYPDLQAAPLLCAGLIGYRSLMMTGDAERIGLYGFGAAAHIVIQTARYQGRQVFGFTRPGDTAGQQFARDLGAIWAGGSDESPPEQLDAAIIFAPVGALVPAALSAIAKGGTVVCAGIHMSDIPSFPYNILWGERVLRSVANLTRRDGEEFLTLAPQIPIYTQVEPFPLGAANEALATLRNGKIQGAAVLVINESNSNQG